MKVHDVLSFLFSSEEGMKYWEAAGGGTDPFLEDKGTAFGHGHWMVHSADVSSKVETASLSEILCQEPLR